MVNEIGQQLRERQEKVDDARNLIQRLYLNK